MDQREQVITVCPVLQRQCKDADTGSTETLVVYNHVIPMCSAEQRHPMWLRPRRCSWPDVHHSHFPSNMRLLPIWQQSGDDQFGKSKGSNGFWLFHCAALLCGHRETAVDPKLTPNIHHKWEVDWIHCCKSQHTRPWAQVVETVTRNWQFWLGESKCCAVSWDLPCSKANLPVYPYDGLNPCEVQANRVPCCWELKSVLMRLDS